MSALITSLLLAAITVVCAAGHCTKECTPIYGAPSAENEDTALLFFSTRLYFHNLNVTTGLVFIRFLDGNPIPYAFKMNEAKRVRNGTYWYIEVPMPANRRNRDCVYQFTASLRGRHINDKELCGPDRCPLMRIPKQCEVTMVSRSTKCTPATTPPAATRSDRCRFMPTELQNFLAAQPTPLVPTSPTPAYSHCYTNTNVVVVCTGAFITAVVVTAVVVGVAIWLCSTVMTGRAKRLVIQVVIGDPEVSNSLLMRAIVMRGESADIVRRRPEYHLSNCMSLLSALPLQYSTMDGNMKNGNLHTGIFTEESNLQGE